MTTSSICQSQTCDRSTLFSWLLTLSCYFETIRIRDHLRRAERELRRTTPGGLNDTQRERRSRHLDTLREYHRRGDFPTNEAVPERCPQFVGGNGVPCAIAALLLADSEDELVATVAATDNSVRIENLTDGPILDWLAENGFTQAEAARIQPGYTETVRLVSDCGPVSCSTARLLASTVALAGAATLEYVGYRLVGDLFPTNVFKRRATLAYVTVLNLLLAPLLAVVLYALFP